jgi:hypothetical protein
MSSFFESGGGMVSYSFRISGSYLVIQTSV